MKQFHLNMIFIQEIRLIMVDKIINEGIFTIIIKTPCITVYKYLELHSDELDIKFVGFNYSSGSQFEMLGLILDDLSLPYHELYTSSI